MKLKKHLLILLVTTPLLYLAQSGDYAVNLAGDTLGPIQSFSAESGDVTVPVHGKIRLYNAGQLRSAYYGGLHYEAVQTDPGKDWMLMIREFSGDVTVFRRIKRNWSPNGDNLDVEKFYFRQKQQSRGQVLLLTKKNLKKVATYSCKPLMDSLVGQMDWSTFLTDVMKYYNERCTATSNGR